MTCTCKLFCEHVTIPGSIAGLPALCVTAQVSMVAAQLAECSGCLWMGMQVSKTWMSFTQERGGT